MKRIFSLGLISAVVFAAIAPLTAQTVRQVKTTKNQSDETATRFAGIRAMSDGGGVLVEWQMAVETNNAGFEVYRLDGERSVRVSASLIPGSAFTYREKPVTNEKYTYFDPEGTQSSVYFVKYLAMNGRSDNSQPTAVDIVADLSNAGYGSSADLQRKTFDSKRNGNPNSEELNLPKPLAGEVLANRPSADANTHAWVMAQQGVRIGVRREGFYRVTRLELQNGGFNVNADPSLWQLYREGVEQAFVLGPNGDYIDFYGKGLDRTETDLAVYFLIVGPSVGKRVAVRTARPYAGTVISPNYAQTFSQKQRLIYLQQILNGDLENYFGTVVSTSLATYNFTLTGVDFSASQAHLELKFQGFSTFPHTVEVTLNGESLAAASGNAQSSFSANYTIPTSFLREGNNTLNFRATASASDLSLFDTVSIAFRRKQLAVQDRLRFYTDNYRLSKLTGFTSANIRVFDLTNESEPVLWTNLSVVPENGTFSVRMPSDRGRSMYAVADTGLQSVAAIQPYDPEILKTSTNAANLVIISHNNFMTQAETWANYRRGQGFTVKVVDVAEIYDEFGYGDLSSVAIRSFLQYARNNWQPGPTYALLIGDASFDYRNYEGLGYNNFVPTHLVDTVFGETGSDDSIADFNGDGLADVAIGRVAARDGQTVTNVYSKVTAWELAAPTLQGRGVLFASDRFDTNNNYDFSQISMRLKNQLPANVPTTMIARDDPITPPDSPQSLLISSVSSGKYLVNFTGHGSLGVWGGTDFFSSNNVPQLTNSANMSIFVMLTCLNGYFLHSSNRSLAENLVDATNGGAVATWASTGETTPDVQEAMATRFFQKLGQGQIQRLGDLVNDAKTVIPGGTDVRLSWALLGDPLLKVQNPTGGDRPAKGR